MIASAATRIVIADDHPIFRTGLAHLIGSEPELRLIGEASDGDEALALVDTLSPDVLLLDLALPRVTGMEVLHQLRQHAAPVRTIVLTAEIERQEVVEALQLGARGVVLKQAATEFLLAGIRAVVAGQHWVERQAVSDLVAVLREQYAAKSPVDRAPAACLTTREMEVIEMIGAGATNRVIAERFAISEHTVKHHLTSIFDKLGVSNRLELALYALHRGIPTGPISGASDQLRPRAATRLTSQPVAHERPAKKK